MPRPNAGTIGPFWRNHALWPSLLFAAVFMVLSATRLDLRLADAFFYRAEIHDWFGAGTWWDVHLIHTGGARLVWLSPLTKPV